MDQNWVKMLCEGLNLEYREHVQDFGVEYAVPNAYRIQEFIEFYERHPEWPDVAKVMLGELIIASIDEMMQIRDQLAEHQEKFGEFMKVFLKSEASKKNEWMIQYWMPKEEDPEPWAVGVWMKGLLEKGLRG